MFVLGLICASVHVFIKKKSLFTFHMIMRATDLVDCVRKVAGLISRVCFVSELFPRGHSQGCPAHRTCTNVNDCVCPDKSCVVNNYCASTINVTTSVKYIR